MSKIPCEVIEDLLPLYVEELASPASRRLVEEHLADCEACYYKKTQMTHTMKLPKEVDTKPLQVIRQALFRKRTTAVILTVLGMLLFTVISLVYLNSPITVFYETVAGSIQVIQSEGGQVHLSLEDMGGEVDLAYSWDPDGVRIATVNIYTTRLRQLLRTPSTTRIYTVGEGADGFSKCPPDDSYQDATKRVQRIYYYPSEVNGGAVCLWQDPDNQGAGPILGEVLPRLTLNYYTIIAGVLTVIGLFSCIAYRKQEKLYGLILKLTLLPAAYVVSSLIILWNRGPIYDVLYYFSGILLSVPVLYAMMVLGVQYVRYRKNRD